MWHIEAKRQCVIGDGCR